MGQLLKKVAGLPDGTIILFFSLLRDGAGHDFIPQEVLSRLSAAARVPIYGPSETQVGAGAVGGRVTSYRAQGVKAAELGLRALRGPPAGPADIVEAEAVLMFDWRQLKRWGLTRIGSLPAARCCTGAIRGSLQVADHRNRGDRWWKRFVGGLLVQRAPAGGVGARRAPAVQTLWQPVGHQQTISPGAKWSGRSTCTPAPLVEARGRPGQTGE